MSEQKTPPKNEKAPLAEAKFSGNGEHGNRTRKTTVKRNSN
jgi:hypothetical protein